MMEGRKCFLSGYDFLRHCWEAKKAGAISASALVSIVSIWINPFNDSLSNYTPKVISHTARGCIDKTPTASPAATV